LRTEWLEEYVEIRTRKWQDVCDSYRSVEVHNFHSSPHLVREIQ